MLSRQAGFAQIGLLVLVILFGVLGSYPRPFGVVVFHGESSADTRQDHSEPSHDDSRETLDKAVVKVENPKPEKENVWEEAMYCAFGMVLVYALCAYFSAIENIFDKGYYDGSYKKDDDDLL